MVSFTGNQFLKFSSQRIFFSICFHGIRVETWTLNTTIDELVDDGLQVGDGAGEEKCWPRDEGS